MDEIDFQIRSGRFESAYNLLKQLRHKVIPRKLKSRFANLFMRIGQPLESLKILNRIVHSKGAKFIHPNDEEIKEYAAALIALGVSSEALELLLELDTESTPEVLLYRSIAYFTQWDYKKSIPLLEVYSASSKISEYQSLVGRVNLLSAYIFENQFENASKVLSQLKKELIKNNINKLLYSNLRELEIQLAFKMGEYKTAKKILNEALDEFKSPLTLSGLFLRKWEALVNCYTDNLELGSIQLRKVACLAKDMQHWETLRECHLYLSLVLNDEHLFRRVYFGTPNEHYRKKMLQNIGAPFIPESFIVHFNDSYDIYPQILDTRTGTVDGEKILSKSNSHIFRLLMILSSDFYSPFRIPEIFKKLFSDEYYNPFNSAHRIHSLINRLRIQLLEDKIPIEIVSKHNHYSLNFLGSFALRVYRDTVLFEKENFRWEHLKSRLSQSPNFCRNDVMKNLNISYRSASRILKWAKLKNYIEPGPKIDQIQFYRMCS